MQDRQPSSAAYCRPASAAIVCSPGDGGFKQSTQHLTERWKVEVHRAEEEKAWPIGGGGSLPRSAGRSSSSRRRVLPTARFWPKSTHPLEASVSSCSRSAG